MFLNRCRAPRRPAFRPSLERLEGRDTPSATVLDVAPNPAIVGQAVTLTATVTQSGLDQVQPGTGSAAGTVTFFDGAAALMTVKVTPKPGTTTQGVAQLTTAALSLGPHSLTAQYSGEDVGDIFFTGVSTSSAVAEVINPPPVPPPVLADVTARASVAGRRGRPRGQQLVTVTNTSGQAIPGPLYLVFSRLPRRVRLKGASGATPAHDPFLLDAGTLLPGGYANFLAAFTGRKAVRFTATVFAGAGTL